MEEIKVRIKKALAERNMTAAELAKKSGIGKGSISKYINGLVIPKRDAVGAMSDALNVSPAWLMGYDLTMDGKELPTDIEINKLSPENRTRLLAYYQALIDSQEDYNANT